MKPLRVFTSLLMMVLFVGCATNRTRTTTSYLQSRPDIEPAVRENILAGKVTVGMYPDEAVVAAGGQFMYLIKPDPALAEFGFTADSILMSVADIRYYDYVAEDPSRPPKIPPHIIFRQRFHPDASEIRLSFGSYYAVIEHGRVTAIRRDGKFDEWLLKKKPAA